MSKVIKPKTREEFYKLIADPKTAQGLYHVPDTWYHEGDGISRSDFVNVLRSPRYYKNRKENPEPSTSAMQFGTAFHTAFLEPDKFTEQVVTGPSVGRATNKWKDFVESNPDKIVLHPTEFEQLNNMLESIRGHSLAMSLLQTKVRELSAYTYFQSLLIKARTDALDEDRSMLVDLKTTQDASPQEFVRSAYKYKYHVQAAFYLDVFNAVADFKLDKFVFVCVEKNPPYDVQCYVCDPEMIKIGRETYRKALETLDYCHTNNEWRGYPEIIMNLTLPKWAV